MATACTDDGAITFALSANAGNNTSYTYSIEAPIPAGFSLTDDNGVDGTLSFDPSAAGVNTTATGNQATVILTDANGCTDSETSAVVTVGVAPDNALTVSDPTICTGDDATITVTAAETNVSYQLLDDDNNVVDGPNTGTGADLDFTVPAANTGDGPFAVVATSTVNTSCTVELTDMGVVTINPNPSATVGGATTVCVDDTAPTITFTGSGGTAPYTFTYNINGGIDQTVSSDDASDDDATVTAPTATSGTFTYDLVSVQDASSTMCDSDITGESAVVTVNPNPSATVGGATTVCVDDTAPTITFTGSGGTAPYTFTYNIDGGSDQTVSSDDASDDDATVTAPTNASGTFTYNLVSVQDASSTMCNSDITGESAVVTVNPNPTITLNDDDSTEPGIQLDCATSTQASLGFSATTAGADTYSIIFDAAAVAAGFSNVGPTTLPASPITFPVPTGANAGTTYTATITVSNSGTTCSSSDQTFEIELFDEITWDGGGDDASWNDPLNWLPNCIPAADDDVTINNATVTIASGTDAVANSVTLSGTSQLTVVESLTLTGTNNSSATRRINVAANSVLTNNGTISIENAESGIRLVGGLTNTGTISIDQVTNEGIRLADGNDDLVFNNTGTINISNTTMITDADGILLQGEIITNGSGGTININGTRYGIIGYGTVNNNSGATFNINTVDFGVYADQGNAASSVELIINNDGTFNNESGFELNDADATIDGDANVDEGDMFMVSSGQTLIINDGTFTNDGIFEIETGGTVTLGAGASFVNSEELKLNGTLNASNGTFTNQGTDAVTRGTGTLNGNYLEDGGTLAPGASPGTITINGNYNATANGGTLEIEVGEDEAPTNSCAAFDFIDISGTADLGGITLLTDFDPDCPRDCTDEFIFLDADGGVSNSFTNATPTEGDDVIVGSVSGTSGGTINYTVEVEGNTATLTPSEPQIDFGTNPASVTVCSGSSADLEFEGITNGGNSYRIEYNAAGFGLNDVPATAVDPNATSISISVSANANSPQTYTGNIFITNTATGCEGPAVQFTLNVVDNPTITLGPDPDVCEDADPQTATLTYTAATELSGTDTYSIDFSTAAESQGFTDETDVAFTGSNMGGSFTIGVPAGADPGVYAATLTVTNDNGCMSTAEAFNINVNAAPTSFTSLEEFYCEDGATDEFNALPLGPNTSYSGLGVIDDGDGTAKFDPTQVTIPAGEISADVTVSATSPGCEGNAGQPLTQTVTVLRLPEVAAENTLIFFECEGVAGSDEATFDLTATASPAIPQAPFTSADVTISYHLNASDAASGNNAISNVAFFTTSDRRIFARVATVNGTSPACFVTTTVDLVVDPKPEISDVSETAVCGDDDNIGVTIPGSENTTGADGYFITNIDNGGLTADPGNATADAMMANPAVDTDAIESDIFVNTTNATVNVVYTIVPVAASTTPSMAGMNAPTSGTAQGPGGCAGEPFTITVPILPQPAVTSTTAMAACSDIATGAVIPGADMGSDPVVSYELVSVDAPGLTAAMGNQAPATGITMTSAISGDIFTNTTAAQVDVVYTFTPSGADCDGADFTVTVPIDPEPVVADQTETVCSDEAIGVTLGNDDDTPQATTYNITAVVGTGLTGTATTGTAQTDDAIETDVFTNNTAGSLDVTYTVTPISAAGCEGDDFTVTVTIDPEPVVTGIFGTNVCSDATIDVTIPASTSVPAASYNLTNIDIPAPLMAATGNVGTGVTTMTDYIENDVYTNEGTTTVSVTYTFTPSSAAGCEGTPFTVVVPIDPEPAVTGTTEPAVCSDTPIGVTIPSSDAGSVAADSYELESVVSTGVTPAAGNQTPAAGLGEDAIEDDEFTNVSGATVNVTYTFTPIAGSCEGDEFTVIVPILPEPVGSDATAAICSEGTFTVDLDGQTDIGATYSWTVAANADVTGQADGSDAATLSQTLTSSTGDVETVVYTVTPTGDNGCVGEPFTVTVTVNPEPVLSGTVNGETLNATTPADVTVCDADMNVEFMLTSLNTDQADTYLEIDFSSSNLVEPTVPAGSPNPFVLPYAQAIAFLEETDDFRLNDTGTPGSATILVTPIYDNSGSVSADACSGDQLTINVTVNPVPVLSGTVNSDPVDGTTAASVTVCDTDDNVDFQLTSLSTMPANTILRVNLTTDNLSQPALPPGDNDIPYNTAITQLSAANDYRLTNGSMSGTATLTVQPFFDANGNGTIDADETCAGEVLNISVTVNPLPVIDAISDATFCPGEAISIALSNITNDDATVYSFSGGADVGIADGTSTGDTPAITGTAVANTTGSDITATITVTATLNGCEYMEEEFDVTVSPTPVIDAISDETFCPGDAIAITVSDITGSASTEYSISGGADVGIADGTVTGSGSDITGTAVVNNTGSDITRTVTVTATLDGCTFSSETFNVTVSPTPVIDAIANPAPFCAGDAISVVVTDNTSSGTTEYSVTGGTSVGIADQTVTGSGSAITGTAVTNNTGVDITATVTVTASLDGCTFSSETFDVTVSPTPVGPATPVEETACNGEPYTLDLQGYVDDEGNAVPSSFTWTAQVPIFITGVSATSGNSSTITETATNNASTPQTIEYTITPTSTANSCTGPSFTVNVTIAPPPGATALPNGDLTLCEDEPRTLNGATSTNPVNPVTYNWTIINETDVTATLNGADAEPGSPVVAQSPELVVDVTDGAMTGEVTVQLIVIDGNGCSSDPSTLTFDVNEMPDPQTIVGEDEPCGEATEAYSVSQVGTNTYSWMLSSGGTITTTNSGTSITIDWASNNGMTPSGPHTLTVTEIDDNDCETVNTLTIFVQPVPTVSISVSETSDIDNDGTLCPGGSADLTAEPDGGTEPFSYEWDNGITDTDAEVTVMPSMTTTYNVTVTDSKGCQAFASTTVTVGDTEAPVITLNGDAIVNLECDEDYTEAGAMVTDNCDAGVTVVIGGDTVDDDMPGTYVVTYNATDASGNEADEVTRTVNVGDDEAPVLVADTDSDTTIVNAPGNCFANVNSIGNPEFTDNCGSITITSNFQPGSYPVGNTEITFTATDGNGNSTTATRTIMVVDNEQPQLAGCVNVTTANDPGECEAQVFYNPPTASDNCPGVSVTTTATFDDGTGPAPATFTVASGDQFPVGVTTITFTATDNAGNTTSCVQTITVNDTELPTITATATIGQTADNDECFATVSVPATVTTDNCPGEVVTYMVDNPGFVASTMNADDASGTFPVGTSTITWTVTDASDNTATATTVITVTDDQLPTISCAADQTEVSVDADMCSAVVTYDAPVSSDNCPGETVTMTATFDDGTGPVAVAMGDFDSGDVFPVGTTVITFEVSDASSNTASCTTTITVVDDELPTIDCAADATRSVDAGTCTYTIVGSEFDPISFEDNCPGVTVTNDLNSTASIAGEVLQPGANSVVFTATDAAGNSAQCTVVITVEDQEAPTIVCATPDASYAADADVAACTYTVPGTDLDPVSATDDCSAVTVTNDFNNAASLQGAAFPLGMTTVTFTVTDASLNTATCQIVVNVVDGEAPVVDCPTTGLTVDSDAGVCTYTATATDFLATATDECDADVTITYGIGAAGMLTDLDGQVFPLGSTTVFVTATDDAGNSSGCTFDVIVEDNEAPVVTCPTPDMSYTADAGVCTAELSFTATATDNCNAAPAITYEVDGATITFPFVFDAGVTTVTVTADDGQGQTDVCTFDVNVVDEEAPTFTAAANTSFDNDAGSCSYTNNGTDLDVADLTDNCIATPTVEYSYDLNDGNGTVTSATLDGVTFPVGITVVTITATDGTNVSMAQNTTVTVVDNEVPTFTLAAVTTFSNDTEECSYEVDGTELDVTDLSDNCGTATVTYSYDIGSGTTTSSTLAGVEFPVGSTIVTVTATDDATTPNTSMPQTMTVTIVDDEAPTFLAADDASFNADASGCTYTVSGTALDVTALVDNCGSATVEYSYDVGNGPETSTTLDGVVFPAGTTVVSITATDNAATPNTSAAQTTEITVTDGEAPQITLTGDNPQVIECPDGYTELGATASDNCDGDISSSIVIDASAVDVTTPGTYTVTYNVMDASGNNAVEVTRSVTVEDTTDPVFDTAPMDMTVECDGAGNTAELNAWLANNAGAVASDGCSTNVTITSMAGTPVAACGNTGSVEYTFTADDNNGNTTSATATFTIEDTTAPTVVAQNIIIDLDASGSATITPMSIDNGSSDLCSGVTLSLDEDTFDCSDADSDVVVTLTATDDCGNAATTTATVTINPTVVAEATPASEEICSQGTTNIALSNSFNSNPATFTWTVSAPASVSGASDGSGSTIAQTLVNTDPDGMSQVVTYTVTPTANTCEGEPISVDVTVLPQPVADDETVAGCSQQTQMIDLQALVDNGVASSFTWQATTTNPNVTGASTTPQMGGTINDFLVNNTPNVQVVVYTVTPTPTGGTGCAAGASFEVLVEVFPVVNAFLLTGSGLELCQGEERQLQAAANNGAQPFIFEWTITATTGSATADLNGMQSFTGVAPVLTADGVGTVTVEMTATDQNGCTSVPQEATFEVLDGPPTVDITGGQDLCTNSTTAITLTGVSSQDASDGTFSIIPASAAAALSDNGDGTASFDPTGLAAGEYEITFTDGISECPGTATEMITISTAPIAGFTFNATSLTVDFTETATNESNYSWDFGDGAGMSTDANPSYTYIGAGTYNVCLTVNNAGCTDVVCQDVTVDFAPTPACDDVTITNGQSMISFDVVPSDSSISTVFANMIAADQLIRVVGRDENGNSVTFDPSIPGPFNSLQSITRGRGYVVYSNADAVVTVCGSAIDPDYRIDLIQGFNIVAYIPTTQVGPAIYFDELIADDALEIVRTREAGIVKQFNPDFPAPFNSLKNMKNGLGYMVRVNASVAGVDWRENLLYDEFGHLKSDVTNFIAGDNISGNLPVGDRVFITAEDGTIHGAMEVLENGHYLMTTPVYGDDATTPGFEGMRIGEKILFQYGSQVRDLGLTFTGNDDLFFVELDFDPRAEQPTGVASTLKVGPSPFQTETNLYVELPKDAHVAIRILNAQGQMVEHLLPGTDLTAGNYSYRWQPNGKFNPGIYYLQLVVNNEERIQQAVVLQ